MNYYVHRSGEVLEHALRERGAERANHKYVARVNVGGRFRYFYTPQELAAYRSGKKVGRAKAEGQASDTNRSNKSSAIKVIRKDGSSQNVKPIKSPRDSKKKGQKIVERLFSSNTKLRILPQKSTDQTKQRILPQKSTDRTKTEPTLESPISQITNPFLRELLGFTAMEKSIEADKAKSTTTKPSNTQTKKKRSNRSKTKRKRRIKVNDKFKIVGDKT